MQGLVTRSPSSPRRAALRGLPFLPALLASALLVSGCRRAPEELSPPAVLSGVVAKASTEPPAASSASSASSAPPGCPKDPEGNPVVPVLPVTIPAAGARVDAELAMNRHDVTRGLMYRTHMPEDRGMLFRMERREEQIFWMQNTCIPLDMLFIDRDGTIVGVLEDVPILNELPRTVSRPSTHVLEVNAGWCKKHGVKAGMKAVLPAQAK